MSEDTAGKAVQSFIRVLLADSVDHEQRLARAAQAEWRSLVDRRSHRSATPGLINCEAYGPVNSGNNIPPSESRQRCPSAGLTAACDWTNMAWVAPHTRPLVRPSTVTQIQESRLATMHPISQLKRRLLCTSSLEQLETAGILLRKDC